MKYLIKAMMAILFCMSTAPSYSMYKNIQTGNFVLNPQARTQYMSAMLGNRITKKSPPKETVVKEMVVIRTVDGTIELEISTAQKLKTIKHLIEDCGLKSEIDLQMIHNKPTVKSIALLIEFIKNPKKISKLDAKEIKTTFEIANYLEAPKNIRNTLAEKLFPIAIKEKNQSVIDNLTWSIKLAQIGQQLEYSPALWFSGCLASKGNATIDLSGKKLQSLDGIEELTSEKTIILNISNNKLEKLELKKIKRAFPNIIAIDAQGNKIKKLTKADIKALSNDLELLLDDNLISQCEQVSFFKTPENVYIGLKRNSLTSSALHNLSSSLQPSKYQQYQQRLKAFYKLLMPIMSTINNILYPRWLVSLSTPSLIAFFTVKSILGLILYQRCFSYIGSDKTDELLFSYLIITRPLLITFPYINRFVTNQANKQFEQNAIELDPKTSYLGLKYKEQNRKSEKLNWNWRQKQNESSIGDID